MTPKQWFFPITRVRQKDWHGCGIAAVASVCGVTYDRARAEFFPDRVRHVDNSTLHVDGKQMIEVVERLGFDVRPVSSPVGQKVPTLFTFTWSKTFNDCYHVVLWDPYEKRIVDPGPDHDRNLTTEFYFYLWKIRRYEAYAVTGRKRST